MGPNEVRATAARLTLVVAVTVFLLFQVTRLLIERSRPAFPRPVLRHRARVAFDGGGAAGAAGPVRKAARPSLLAMAVSPEGKIGLLDSGSGVIQVFGADGGFLCQTPAAFPGAGGPRRPLDLAFGADGEILLADTGNQRIVRFSPDGTLGSLGRPGVFHGQFVMPTSLTVVGDQLFVLDSSLCRIQQFDADGRFAARVGRKGAGPDGFRLPVSLCRDPDGNVVALDCRAGSLSRFDSLLGFLDRRRISTLDPGFSPTRIAFAGEGLMFVLSRPTQEVVVFYQNTAVAVLTPAGLGLEQAWWTDIEGREDTIYLLDGKNLAVDLFDLG